MEGLDESLVRCIRVELQANGAIDVGGLGGKLFTRDRRSAQAVRQQHGSFGQFLAKRPEFVVVTSTSGKKLVSLAAQTKSRSNPQAGLSSHEGPPCSHGPSVQRLREMLEARGGCVLLCSLLSREKALAQQLRREFGSLKQCLRKYPQHFTLSGSGASETVSLASRPSGNLNKISAEKQKEVVEMKSEVKKDVPSKDVPSNAETVQDSKPMTNGRSSAQDTVSPNAKRSCELHTVLFELSGRSAALTDCWKKVMDDLNLTLHADAKDLKLLSDASHEQLSKRLALWSKVQRKVNPVLEQIQAQKDEFVSVVKGAYSTLSKLYASDKWTEVSGDVSSLDSTLISTHGEWRKAETFLRCDCSTVVNHIWSRQNDATDVALFFWGARFELRQQYIPLKGVPVVNPRDVVYARTVVKVREGLWAVVSRSVSVKGVKFLDETETTTRADICDAYFVEELPHAISRIVRIARFQTRGLPFLVTKTAAADRFLVEYGVEALRKSLKDRSLLPLAALGAGAVVGGVAGPAAVTGAVAALGFQAGGIVAGSAAAGMMSAAGSVAAGSTVATLQSVGAAGLVGGPLGLAIAGGAIIVGGLAVGIFFAGKAIHEKVEDKKRRPSQAVHHCPICDDRKFLNKL